MRFKIQIIPNNEDECFDLVDLNSDQSHDQDESKELIAKVYEHRYAVLIADLLERDLLEVIQGGKK